MKFKTENDIPTTVKQWFHRKSQRVIRLYEVHSSEGGWMRIWPMKELPNDITTYCFTNGEMFADFTKAEVES